MRAARGLGGHDRRRRHRRRPDRARPRREGADHLEPLTGTGRCPRRQRPRDLRRLARRGLGDNGEGIAGFGGDARLLVVKANRATGRSPTSTRRPRSSSGRPRRADHQPELRWPGASAIERHAIDYAVYPACCSSRRPATSTRGRPGRSTRRRCCSRRLDGAAARASSSRPRRRRLARARSRIRARVSLAAPGGDVLRRRPSSRRPRSPARQRCRARGRALRLRQRHVVRGAAGRRRGRARLGGEPEAHRAPGRADPEGDGAGNGRWTPTRLRRARRRRRGRPGHSGLLGVLLAGRRVGRALLLSGAAARRRYPLTIGTDGRHRRRRSSA